jgi:hypothetical protein
MWGRDICGQKQQLDMSAVQYEKLHTLFRPSSCECCKEAHDQCEQRVRSHGWGFPFGTWKVGGDREAAGGLCSQKFSSAASPLNSPNVVQSL